MPRSSEGLAAAMAAQQGTRTTAGPYGAQRNFSYELLKKSLEDEDIVSPWQGVSKMAKAIAGAAGVHFADQGQKEEEQQQKQRMSEVLAEPDQAKRETMAAGLGMDGFKMAWQQKMQRQAAESERAAALEEARVMLGISPTGAGTPSAGGMPQGAAPSGMPQAEPAPEPQENPDMIPPQQAVVVGQRLTELAQRNPKATIAELMREAHGPDAEGHIQRVIQGGVNPYAPLGEYAQRPEAAQQMIMALPRAFADKISGPPSGGAQPATGAPSQGGGPQPPIPDGPTPQGPTGQAPGLPPNVIPAQAPMPQRGQPSQEGGDPGAQLAAAARRALEAGNPQLSVKLSTMAVQARQAAANRPPRPERALQHIDMGDSIHIIEPSTGATVRVIPKGAKPTDKEPGGPSMSPARAWGIIVEGATNPEIAKSPGYAAAHAFLGKPHQSLHEQSGKMITHEGVDLSRFPAPGFGVAAAPSAPGQPPPPLPQGPGPSVQAGPPGAPAAPRGAFSTPVPGIEEKPLNEGQAKAAGFSSRMSEADRIIDQFALEGTSARGRILGALPFGAGNAAQSTQYQQFEQAKRNFLNAQLRRESGATIQPPEFESADKQYFPQPGDKPEVIAQKAENRRLAVEAMMIEGTTLKKGERYTPKARAAEGKDPLDGQTAVNPSTGARVVRRGGKWEPAQ